jgi:hypothetical protein
MFGKQKLILLLLFFFCHQVSFSQIEKVTKDSSEVYKNIQNYSNKNKFTKFLHKLIFEPVNFKKKNPTVKQQNLLTFEGKIIRNINITTLDPFGFSEIDSTRKPRNWGERTGNKLHIKTKRLAIKNLLLLKKGKPLDSLLVRESERLIRTQRYISRVIISPELISQNPDSVDVNIRVLDSWSFVPNASVSGSRTSFQINEHNFLGTGMEFDNRYTKRFTDGKQANSFDYIIPNITNTFIRTTLSYHIDLDNFYRKSINIERPFYSPLTKWAGGIYADQLFRKDTLQDANLTYALQNFKYNSQDYWLGHAIKIYKGNSIYERTTNLIISGRFFEKRFLDSPTISYDPDNFFSSEKLYLSGIGITTRKFVEDKYIFRNGLIEDIPIGKIYGITGGYQYKNNAGRYYLGGQASFGNYFKWGFLSTNFEFGSFFDKSVTSQTAFSFQANYFTNLFEFGRWKLRQFVKPQFTLGINRMNSIGDKLTINENFGITGFNSALYGTKKMMVTLQTQTYSPWNLGGFRLNPYFNYTMALLADSGNQLQNCKMYSKIGIGLIINNDYLVFSSFQISLAYFPSIPGNGENIFKTNSFETSDFGLQDFELAKPRTVIFK